MVTFLPRDIVMSSLLDYPVGCPTFFREELINIFFRESYIRQPNITKKNL